MRAIESWLRNRRFGTKIMFLSVIAIAGIAVSAAVGIVAQSRSEKGADQLAAAAVLTRAALEADMAHDAVRGDVLRALVAGQGGAVNASELDEVTGDLGAHSDIMRDKLALLDGAAAPPSARSAADRVRPMIDRYLELAATVLRTATSGGARGADTAGWAAFSTSFSEVEENLPAVGDALETHANDVADAVSAQRHTTTWLLIATALVAGALLAATGWLIARGVLRPLRQVSGVLDGLAAGDLTRTADAAGRDEMAVMARALNTAIDSIRGTLGAVTGSAGTVARSAGDMARSTQSIAASARDVSDRAVAAAGAADAITRNISTTAAGGTQMGTSIGEIARNAAEAVRVVNEAVSMATRANGIMLELGESSGEISSVVNLITTIAEQTNLLALNATIEAARAGDAGKGFAVVASEVKDLAQETARATDEIARRVTSIQDGTSGAVTAIGDMTAVIERINEFQTLIAAAVEQQSATTSEMNRNIHEAVTRSGEISETISAIAGSARSSFTDAATSQDAVGQLSTLAEDLRSQVSRFRL
jgi:methyl-accepting chemotaxis protein